MGTHNILFCEEIRKISILLDWKTSYQELWYFKESKYQILAVNAVP